RVTYILQNKQGNQIEGSYVFSVIGDARELKDGDYRFHELELIPDKKQYAPGEIVRLMINSNNEDANILLFLRPQGGVDDDRKLINLKGKSAFVEIAVATTDMRNLFVEAVTIIDGEVYTEVKEIIIPPAERVLNVELTPNKTEFLPGEKATMEVK